MEQVLIWRKAVIGSVGFHLIAAVALGVIGYHMSQMAATDAYEIDLSIPAAQEETITKQVEFPKPLAVEDVSQRVAAVSQHTNPAAGGYGGGTPSETPQSVAPASVVARARWQYRERMKVPERVLTVSAKARMSRVVLLGKALAAVKAAVSVTVMNRAWHRGNRLIRTVFGVLLMPINPIRR